MGPIGRCRGARALQFIPLDSHGRREYIGGSRFLIGVIDRGMYTDIDHP